MSLTEFAGSKRRITKEFVIARRSDTRGTTYYVWFDDDL